MLPSIVASDSEALERIDDTVACFDILLPYGYAEVCGGSLREHRLPNLIQAMRERGLLRKAASGEDSPYPHLEPGESLGNLEWYADLRRFGTSPHGGFGMGFDRLLAYLTGPASVRDVVGFPRYWGRAEC
jgi:asparaginyl-tRNA synthetase